ncbi:MAG: TonB-dependent receptor [Gemmatimonadaceae bacterium]
MRHAFILALVCPTGLWSQQPVRSDTTQLNAIVVTAERARSAIGSSVSAVTRVSGADLARMPGVTLADVLRLAPGISVVSFDGLGYDPQVMARGFYGGGEAEYVVVLVDGRPVNQLHTGVVAWDVLPPVASIEAVEIVRGGGSSLYGDAAVAGVINVVTRGARATGAERLRVDVAGGSYGTLRAAADLAAPSAWKGVSLSGGMDRTTGFREHASRNTERVRATSELLQTPKSRLAVTLGSNWRSFDEPGPLLGSLLAVDRRGSDPLFRFDHTNDRTHTLSFDGEHHAGATRFSASATGEYRAFDAIRTLALAPGFGDTKERDATESRAGVGAQAEMADSPLPGRDRLIIGAEGSLGSLESKYYEIPTEDRISPATASGERGALDTQGSSRRDAVALYADYSVQPVKALRLTLGGRFDRLSDVFDPDVPVGGSRATPSHSSFSPKGGLNFQYLNGDGRRGNVYLAVSRSFKAPTLDQLYDQRRFPVPFPPFKISTSNPGLRPQHGVNMEGGLYQGADLGSDAHLSASISGYQIDMTDELDFDITALKYVNIGRSRHRGLEASANVGGSRSSAFVSYALTDARSRSGESDGHRLKAIPRHTLNGGLTVAPFTFLDASLDATHVRGIFLDDANAVTLPNYTRVDLRLGVRARGRSLFAEFRNLFDARYSGTGFLDPAGTGQVYFYPAAGRTFEVGVRTGF